MSQTHLSSSVVVLSPPTEDSPPVGDDGHLEQGGHVEHPYEECDGGDVELRAEEDEGGGQWARHREQEELNTHYCHGWSGGVRKYRYLIPCINANMSTILHFSFNLF